MRNVCGKFILFVLLFGSLLTNSIYASYGTEHISIGQIKHGSEDIPVKYQPSISSHGYTQIVDDAIANWEIGSGGTASFIKVNDDERVVIGTALELPSGTYGRCQYVGYAWYGTYNIDWSDVKSGTNFDGAFITLNSNAFEDFTSYEKTKTTGHEFGHVLSLNHFEDSPSHSGNHWMKSGKISLPAPTSTDLDHLEEKWGD